MFELLNNLTWIYWRQKSFFCSLFLELNLVQQFLVYLMFRHSPGNGCHADYVDGSKDFTVFQNSHLNFLE